MNHNRAAPNGKAKPGKPPRIKNPATGSFKTQSDKMQAGGRIPTCTCKINVSGALVKLTFSTAVVVTGSLDLFPAGLSLESQQQIDQSTWLLTYSMAVYNIPYAGLAEGNSIVSPSNGSHFNGIRPGTFD